MLYQMDDIYLLILASHAEGEGRLVFDYQLAFLQSGNSGADLL